MTDEAAGDARPLLRQETELITNERGISCSTLDQAAIGTTLAVLKVSAPAQAPEWERWLEEIGFITGEHVRLMAKAIPGGDPMVVRIGQSTFALRRAEAACVSVVPVDALAPASSLDRVAIEGGRV